MLKVDEKTLKRAQGIGRKTVKLENIVKEETIPVKHNMEQSVEDKIKLRQKSINTLHNEIARLQELDSTEINKYHMTTKGSVLDKLVERGIVDSKDKQYKNSKSIVDQYATKNEEKELVEEIEEILGDPIKEEKPVEGEK